MSFLRCCGGTEQQHLTALRDYSWKAESGLQHYRYPVSKYVNRCNFRLKCSGTIKLYSDSLDEQWAII